MPLMLCHMRWPCTVLVRLKICDSCARILYILRHMVYQHFRRDIVHSTDVECVWASVCLPLVLILSCISCFLYLFSNFLYDYVILFCMNTMYGIEYAWMAMNHRRKNVNNFQVTQNSRNFFFYFPFWMECVHFQLGFGNELFCILCFKRKWRF